MYIILRELVFNEHSILYQLRKVSFSLIQRKNYSVTFPVDLTQQQHNLIHLLFVFFITRTNRYWWGKTSERVKWDLSETTSKSFFNKCVFYSYIIKYLVRGIFKETIPLQVILLERKMMRNRGSQQVLLPQERSTNRLKT